MTRFKDMPIPDQMDFCARYLIVHSILYYEMNKNIIIDSQFDEKLKWLYKYTKKYPLYIKSCQYKDLLLNLDPCSGYYMQNYIETTHYKYLQNLASHIYKQYKLDNVKEKGRI